MTLIDTLFNEKTTATMLSVAPGTLRRWRWAGVGPTYIKVGHAVRYKAAAVDAFIASGTVVPGVAGLS
ncbi:hypothetical protein GCM10011529_27440 [Polymorphobacter glacialis]|uniref:Helix-turn-helix domain-containing protein n=1 Tax=Sandarakinorhabdus glacialis TaxID=1614636 RepID=A0A916ZYM2_9SPHN|nr:helix-turn-helix domain-containing protein [Polymorphobacter glacialis]GGE19412.1 hypothetical protein GCM10011529_27440 [Polymorphobacter glacialis]